MDCKLTYADHASYDPTATVVAYNTYRANGLYDPDYTSTGHQPLGYDQWSALYFCWVVPYVDVEMTLTPGSTDTQGVCYGFLWQSTPTIVSTDVNVLRECSFGKTAFFVPDSGRPLTLKARVPNWRMFALDELDYIEQGPNGFGGCTAQDPARGSYLFTWVGTTINSSDPVSVNVNIKLTYGARFTSPIPQTASLFREGRIIEKPPVRAIKQEPLSEKAAEKKQNTPIVFLL
jgi:hypothetical protein